MIDGPTVTFTHTGDDLQSVDHGGGYGESYTYVNHNLTSVVDGGGRTQESHVYTGERVTSTSGESGSRSRTLVYGTNQTQVTDSLGNLTTYNYDPVLRLVTNIAGPGCGCGGGQSVQYTWNRRHEKTQEVDALGHTTQFTYDPNWGNILTRTEAVGSALQRTTTYTYHPTWQRISSVTVPSVDGIPGHNKVTSLTYDASNGNLLTSSESGFSDGNAFSYTTTYSNYTSHGDVGQVDGPRTDIADLTSYSYYPDSLKGASTSLRGRLQSITDGAGNMTSFLNYDLQGNVTSQSDANGVITDSTYNIRNQLLSRTIRGAQPSGDATTSFQYDLSEDLTLQRLPEQQPSGPATTYSTTFAGGEKTLLVTDPVGNTQEHVFNTEGLRRLLRFRDPASQETFLETYEYDGFLRPQKLIHSDATLTRDYGDETLSLSYDDPSVSFGKGRRTGAIDTADNL